MDEEKANKILEVYRNGYIGTTKKGNNLFFARQDKNDIEDIKKLNNNDLVNEWKSLVYINDICGQISLNELQRINLIELEIEDRKDIDKEELKTWYETEDKNFEED